MNNSESADAHPPGVVGQIELLIHIAQMGDLYILRLLQGLGRDDCFTGAERNRVAGVARETQSGLILIDHEVGSSCIGISAVGHEIRKSPIKILVWIGLEDDCVDEVAISLHVGNRQHRAAEKAIKGAIEMSKVSAITSPMEWIKTKQTAQSLRHHRSLHWMKTARSRGSSRHHKNTVWRHRSVWISQIPREQIHFRIDVARRA